MAIQTRIAVDAMGGDSAPEAPIHGALLALRENPDIHVQLVGKPGIIEEVLSKMIRYRREKGLIEIIPADDRIGMDEKGTDALRKKKASPMHVGLDTQLSGKSDALVSAGNTAALVAISFIKLGCIEGIDRPALAAAFPTKLGKPCLLLDVGAIVDATAKQLAQCAILGSIYAQYVMGINKPTVGLMNVGKEQEKGSRVINEAHKEITKIHVNGQLNAFENVEGGDILLGTKDVIICDGYTGNALLKQVESIMPAIGSLLKSTVKKGHLDQKLFAGVAKILLHPTIGALKRALDYEVYGGAPLLGLKGIVIKAHGKSTPTAIMHAIKNAQLAVQQDINGVIRRKLGQMSL